MTALLSIWKEEGSREVSFGTRSAPQRLQSSGPRRILASPITTRSSNWCWASQGQASRLRMVLKLTSSA